MEGGRRITASPGGWSRGVGRVFGGGNKKRRRGGAPDNGLLNSVKKLQRREISSKKDAAFVLTNAHEKFRNMRLTVCSLHFSLLSVLITTV